MIGIYKITNLVDGKCYIGQSRQIERRWVNHIIASNNINDKGYNYPLYQAIRKYGLSNFDFSVVEECSINQLNEKESYYIQYYNAEYNQTIGGDYQVIPQKLTLEQVQEIKNILINDKEGQVSHQKLAEKYNVNKDTIRDINVGRTWFEEYLHYPLHYSKYDPRIKQHYYCQDCGIEITRGALRCSECNIKYKKAQTEIIISREELKNLIRSTPFTQIGLKFGVSDNATRKWCTKYNLPKTKKEIKQYSDKDWANI